MFIALVLFSNLRVSGSLILKDLLEPCVINKIMRTGGSLRGFEVTRIGVFLILYYFPQKDTTGGPLFLKCSHNPNWWLLMKSNYSPGQNQTFHVNQRVFEVFEITKTSGSLILIFFKIKSWRFSDSIIFIEPESVVVNEIKLPAQRTTSPFKQTESSLKFSK